MRYSIEGNSKPTFIIGDDITKCIYDTVETIQASNFSLHEKQFFCSMAGKER
jgi:hypothetical protein